ncbi:hypothetical protein V2G26_001492 [Clonostachys chloroleuca]
MTPTEELARAVELPPFTAHEEGDTLTFSEEYTQLGFARDTGSDSMNHITPDHFTSLQQDAGEFQDPSLLSWQPQDLVDATSGASTIASVGNLIRPTEQPWQPSLSSWPLHHLIQDGWQHSYQTGLGELLPPTWELSQGTARALQHLPVVQTPPHSLPRRRSRYLFSPELPTIPGPIETPGPNMLAEGEMDPIQRWRNSPRRPSQPRYPPLQTL